MQMLRAQYRINK